MVEELMLVMMKMMRIDYDLFVAADPMTIHCLGSSLSVCPTCRALPANVPTDLPPLQPAFQSSRSRLSPRRRVDKGASELLDEPGVLGDEACSVWNPLVTL